MIDTDVAIGIEIDAIIARELDEFERRVYERFSEVISYELRESKMNIRRNLVRFIIDLKALVESRNEEIKAAMKVYTPAGKRKGKTLSKLALKRKEKEEREKHK